MLRPCSGRNQKGVSLIELVIGGMILVASIVPLYQMFSSSNKLKEQSSNQSLAHLVMHHVLESIYARSNGSKMKDIPVHDFQAIAGKKDSISPYFRDLEKKPLIHDQLRPFLNRELQDFQLKVESAPALELNEEQALEMTVTVRYPNELLKKIRDLKFCIIVGGHSRL